MGVGHWIVEGSLSFEEFVQLEGTQNCVAKLLLGTPCLPLNAVAVATKRLGSDFVFVGLTEYWALSICLFHALFDGAEPDNTEFENYHATPEVTLPVNASYAFDGNRIDMMLYSKAA